MARAQAERVGMAHAQAERVGMARAAEHARVLWVTEEPPDRGRGGGSIRQFHLFRALASSVPVALLIAGTVEDRQIHGLAAEIVELPRRDAYWSEHPLLRRLLELAVTVGSAYPLDAYPAKRARSDLARVLRRCAGDHELVCVEHAALAPLRPRSGKSVITFHHLLSGMIAQRLAMTTGRRQRWFLRRDLRKARRLEAGALRSYDLVIVCSEEDAAALGQLRGNGSARVAVIPNGVDVSAFPVTPPPAEPRVLFPGTLSYAPNVDGALWFCEQVWPRIREAVPGATLELAGRDPIDPILSLGQIPGVRVSPNVPSMVPHFERSRVVIVPLRIGTGTRLKALEAMAAARPLVGTTVGLEGIGVQDRVHARIADEPAALADAVVELLLDDRAARAVGAAGRAHVETRFDWESVGARFAALLGELLAAPLASPASTTAASENAATP